MSASLAACPVNLAKEESCNNCLQGECHGDFGYGCTVLRGFGGAVAGRGNGIKLGDFGHMTFRNFIVDTIRPFMVSGNAASPVNGMRFENVKGGVKGGRRLTSPMPLMSFLRKCAVLQSGRRNETVVPEFVGFKEDANNVKLHRKNPSSSTAGLRTCRHRRADMAWMGGFYDGLPCRLSICV